MDSGGSAGVQLFGRLFRLKRLLKKPLLLRKPRQRPLHPKLPPRKLLLQK